MTAARKARAVGFNHVALEVGDIEEALAFYGRLFDFTLRGKSADMAFIDLGDQFLALQKGRRQAADDGRHFGLVVDDKEAVRRALKDAGIKPLPGRFLDFRDPWGNRIEIVGYDNIQFTKAANVLRGMGLGCARATTYVFGNALIAAEMTRHDVRAGLYVPLRLLVRENSADEVLVTYDQPSATLAQFHRAEIDAVARSLDDKVQRLIAETIKRICRQ